MVDMFIVVMYTMIIMYIVMYTMVMYVVVMYIKAVMHFVGMYTMFCVPFYVYHGFYAYVSYIIGGTRSIMFIIVGNGLGNPNSNHG